MIDAVGTYVAASCLYAGFQLTVGAVVYPQMALVPEPAWVRYEQEHQRRVSLVVGPLFAGLVLTTGALALGQGVPGWGAAAAMLLLAMLLAVTAFAAVPQHRALSRGFERAAHRRLVRWDRVRVVLALGQVVLGLLLLASAP